MTLSSERTFTWEYLIGFWWQFVRPWKPGFWLFFNDCFYLSGSVWMLVSFSLIWGPDFCLQTFCCCFLHSFFPPHALPPLTAFFFFFSSRLAHCLCLPPSQFCSSALRSYGRWHLESSPLSCTRRWSGTPGRRQNAIPRNVCQAKRLHDRCSSKAQQEVLVEQKNHLQPETAKRLWSSKAWCFCVQARIFVWNMNLLFNHLGQKWLQKILTQWLHTTIKKMPLQKLHNT